MQGCSKYLYLYYIMHILISIKENLESVGWFLNLYFNNEVQV